MLIALAREREVKIAFEFKTMFLRTDRPSVLFVCLCKASFGPLLSQRNGCADFPVFHDKMTGDMTDESDFDS